MPDKKQSQLTTVAPLGTDTVTGVQAGTNVNYTTDSIAARATSNGAASAASLTSHIADTNNPHVVTLAQVGGAPVGAKYIVQTADSTLTNEQALGALATGLLKNTTTTGVLSIAVGDTDYTLPATFSAHTGNTGNPHSTTAAQVGAYTTAQTDTLLVGKANTSHTHAASDVVSGLLSLARGGTGADLSATGGSNQVVKQTSAGGVFTVGALVAGDIPSLDSAKITTGEIPRSPLTTRGDLLTRDATTHTRLALGSVGRFVRSDGTDPSWQLLVAGDIPNLDANKITTGTLAAARGGTGVSNAGTLTNASNTTITGGGTLSLGGFTLTVPASGTLPLGTGSSGQLAFWTGTNTLSSDGNLLWDTTNKYLGIGTSPSSPLQIFRVFTATSGSASARITHRLQPSGGAHTGQDYALNVQADDTGATQNTNSLTGQNVFAYHYGSGTSTLHRGLYCEATMESGCGNVSTLIGSRYSVYNASSATATEAYGLQVALNEFQSGAITTGYLLKLLGGASGVVTAWGLYQDTAAVSNYCAGKLALGSPSPIALLTLYPPDAGTRGIIVKAAASQYANLQEWTDGSWNVCTTISENGYFTTRKTSAPADGELDNGEFALWFDATAGAAKLMVKAKNASGTVVTGLLALT